MIFLPWHSISWSDTGGNHTRTGGSQFSLGDLGHGPIVIVVADGPPLGFVVFEILIWNTFHAVDFYFNIASIGQSIGNFVNCLFMHLHTMYRETRTSIQFFMANMTLKMLGFLVLNQDFLIIKLTIAIPKKESQTTYYLT